MHNLMPPAAYYCIYLAELQVIRRYLLYDYQ